MAFGDTSVQRALTAGVLAARLSAFDPDLDENPRPSPLDALVSRTQPGLAGQGLTHLAPMPSFLNTAPGIQTSPTSPLDQLTETSPEPVPDLTAEIHAIDEALNVDPVLIRNDGPLVATADPNALFQRNRQAAETTGAGLQAIADIKAKTDFSGGKFSFAGAALKSAALDYALQSAGVPVSMAATIEMANYLRSSEPVGVRDSGRYTPDPVGYSAMQATTAAYQPPALNTGLYERSGIAQQSLVADISGLDMARLEQDVQFKDTKALLAYDIMKTRAEQGVQISVAEAKEVSVDRNAGERLKVGPAGITYYDTNKGPSGMA